MADNNSSGFYTVVGGAISSVSGLLAVGVRVRIDKKTEITNIKLILIDDMENIISITDKMIETCKKTHTISNDYLNELNESISAYYPQKHRILLINDSEVRKKLP